MKGRPSPLTSLSVADLETHFGAAKSKEYAAIFKKLIDSNHFTCVGDILNKLAGKHHTMMVQCSDAIAQEAINAGVKDKETAEKFGDEITIGVIVHLVAHVRAEPSFKIVFDGMMAQNNMHVIETHHSAGRA
jgi:hypothetical protein